MAGRPGNETIHRFIALSGSMNVRICFYLAGLYCSGWVKRGPYGNTPVTMRDAFETADKILEDLEQGKTASSMHVCASQVKP